MEQIPCWKRRLAAVGSSCQAGENQSNQEVKLREGSTFTAESFVRGGGGEGQNLSGAQNYF